MSNLPVLMAKKGIRSIAALSKETGISRNAISDLYSGSGKGVQFSTLEKICNALDVEVGELLQRSNAS